MAQTSTPHIAVVIPSWNSKEDLPVCLNSLLQQSIPCEIIVVENGSTDGSLEFLTKNYPQITVLPQKTNLGFDGGVNVGIRYALEKKYEYIALFNNDAVAHKDWLKYLLKTLVDNPRAGIVTCKLMDIHKTHLDSTGDIYTTWGLAYPRGRGEPVSDKYDTLVNIFAASGGASLYRSTMFKQIGIFDEKFFAYYEDVDISFRAQLAGWKVLFAPKAIAYHQIGATSGRIEGFTTYQTMKNLPMLFWKNTPTPFLPSMLPRFTFAYTTLIASALVDGRGWPAVKGLVVSIKNIAHTLHERKRIKALKTVPNEYIWSILTHDLPPNAHKLRNFRSFWWRIRRKV